MGASDFAAQGMGPRDRRERWKKERKEANWRAQVENTGRRNKRAIKDLRHSDADQRRLIRESGGKKAAKPAPKPKGDQQIEPPKQQQSTELSGAQKIVNDYQNSLKNQKSPWEQAQNSVESSGNFSQPQSSSTQSSSSNDRWNTSDYNFQRGQMDSENRKAQAQSLADKYKLNLIGSGATKPQSATDSILAADRRNDLTAQYDAQSTMNQVAKSLNLFET